MCSSDQIDSIRTTLFFVALFVTIIGIVLGFATQQYPTNPEEAKMFSFSIIKALGLAYVPSMMCIGSTLVLLVLSIMLQRDAGRVIARGRSVLYRIAFFNEPVQGGDVS